MGLSEVNYPYSCYIIKGLRVLCTEKLWCWTECKHIQPLNHVRFCFVIWSLMTNSFARLERVAGKNPHQSSWCGLCMLYQSSKSQLIREHVHGMISHFSNQGASLHYNFFRFRDAHATIDTSFRSVMVLRKSRASSYFCLFYFIFKFIFLI